MTRLAKHFSCFVAVAALGALGGPALAASQRTFVASTGNDANPCSISQPCRSFGVAIAQTNADGEVIVLDSAGYGSFTILQAVSVIAPPGVYAGITVTGIAGVTVSAGSFSTVVLRGLTIDGGGGLHGIVVNSAKQVHIENCTISGMAQEGVHIPGGNYIRIANTLLRSNGLSGVFIPKANTVTVAIENTRAAHNGQVGYFLQGASQVTPFNSSATDHAGSGVYVDADTGFPNVVIVGGEFSGNGGRGIDFNATGGANAGVAATRISASRNASCGIAQQAFPDFGAPLTTAASSISHSHVTWNGASGLCTGSFGGHLVPIAISHSVFSENGVYGIQTNGASGTIVNVHGNSVSRNAEFDFAQTNGGQMFTFGTNALTGNAGSTDILGSLTGKSLR